MYDTKSFLKSKRFWGAVLIGGGWAAKTFLGVSIDVKFIEDHVVNIVELVGYIVATYGAMTASHKLGLKDK